MTAPPHEQVFGSAPQPRPTLRVGGLLIAEGRLLMVEQARGGDRYWLVPGGGVEFGETLDAALRREFREELGLDVTTHELLAIVESISPDPAYTKHVVHLLFAVEPSGGAPPAPHDDAILTAAFLDGASLRRADVRPPVNDFLCACLRELPPTPQYLGRRW